MLIKQLYVFVENQQGKLREITDILSQAQVDIRALSIADTTNFGILRLIVSDPEQAVAALKKQGFTVSLTEVIGIGVDDKPGGLAHALDVLGEAGLDVEYLYAFVSKSEKACVILRLEDNQKALDALKAAGVPVLKELY